jgi:hypothetical protein
MQSRYWQVALLLAFSIAGSSTAGIQGTDVGVRPLNNGDIEYCLDASSVRHSRDGWTYFQRQPCLDQVSRAVERYRVQCAQDPSGPFAYEMRQGEEWVGFTAQRSDELGKTIARVCKFKKLPKRSPPPPLLQ